MAKRHRGGHKGGRKKLTVIGPHLGARHTARMHHTSRKRVRRKKA